MSGAASAVRADGPQDLMFPHRDTCYMRDYGPDHLASYPAQRVVKFALIQTTEGVPAGMLGLWVRLTVRNSPAGQRFDGIGYCAADGPKRLSCTMEGDAGSFTVTPAKNGAVLVEVCPQGVSFEGGNGFETLESDRGDDRTFILYPAVCS
jgi:hypothetical protein